MPKTCVAFGCSNITSEEVSLHTFPKDEKLRQDWIKQVQRTRDRCTPSKTSALCSDHFTADCFEDTPSLQKSVGLKVRFKKVLKPGSIPTIFKRKSTEESATASTSKKRREATVGKLTRKRDIAEIMSRMPDTTIATSGEPCPTEQQGPSEKPGPSGQSSGHTVMHITKSHVSIQRGLTFPRLKRCTTCCSQGQYHCPFCSPAFYKPATHSRVKRHLQIHIRRACFIGEYTIHKCSLECCARPHYHCLYCIAPMVNKQDLDRHVSFCKGTRRTTESQEDDANGAAVGETIESSSYSESRDDNKNVELYTIPFPEDKPKQERSCITSASHFVSMSKKPKMSGGKKQLPKLVLSICHQMVHRMVQTNIDRPQDCDEFYFMNLVKLFKKLTPWKKTEVRMKIERILFEAEFQ